MNALSLLSFLYTLVTVKIKKFVIARGRLITRRLRYILAIIVLMADLFMQRAS